LSPGLGLAWQVHCHLSHTPNPSQQDMIVEPGTALSPVGALETEITLLLPLDLTFGVG
jgi:hypothetical protein